MALMDMGIIPGSSILREVLLMPKKGPLGIGVAWFGCTICLAGGNSNARVYEAVSNLGEVTRDLVRLHHATKA